MHEDNIWANPSASDTAEVASMAGFLETRSQFPDQIAVNTRLMEIIAPQRGQHLLEVGCGTGVLCRLAAPALVPDGLVIGVDLSPDMVDAAKSLAGRAGLVDASLRFDLGSGEALAYDTGSFDTVFAARLLLHASDRGRVVREMARVARPGGRVVLMDWDFDWMQ